jgi:hypothetical protein
MSNLHFIGGEKGGVGKSLVARALAQYLIDREQPFLGFDTDRSHGSLLRFYSDFTSPTIIDRYESLDRIIESAAEAPERRILVDLAAQTHQFLVQWIEDSGVLDLSGDLGLTLNYWHVMDSGQDSVDLLRQLLDQFGSRLAVTVVLNEVRGDRFGLLDASGERARAEGLGAKVVSIPRMQDATMQKIDGHSLSFWAAGNNVDRANQALGLLERQRVKVWLKKVYDQFGRLDI